MATRESISFARLVKEESAKAERSVSEKKALLSSFVRINGYLRIRGKQEGLELSSENSAIAKCVYQYLHELYGVDVRFAYTRSAGFLKRMIYHVIVDDEASKILDDLEVDFFNPERPKNIISSSEDVAAYLTGAFLAGGSVNNPHSRSYHLEISVKDEGFAKFLLKIWSKYQPHPFSCKLSKRRNQYVLYLKRGDEISDFLVLMGAKDQCLVFEDVRISRDFSSIGNRLSNLDTANYGRVVSASKRQIEEINYIFKKEGKENISNPKLLACMELRVKNPDASLDELSKLLSSELNTEISKSNINHLLRYVHTHAEELRNGQ
ncbi:MAG: DNA-binding protein WhiA [Bacilli bacterium]|nr:DNA-binding protein WhiA [Bacilli bacterium]MBR6225802.1 DNA-binding protein WhiA [Bacilli bacterium]